MSRRHFAPLNSSALVRPVGGKETAVSYDFVKRKLDPGRSILRGTREKKKEKEKTESGKRGSLISKSVTRKR